MTTKTRYRAAQVQEQADRFPIPINRRAVVALEASATDQITYNLRGLDSGPHGSTFPFYIWVQKAFKAIRLDGAWIAPYAVSDFSWFLVVPPAPGLTLLDNNSDVSVTINVGLDIPGQEVAHRPSVNAGGGAIAAHTRKWLWIKDQQGAMELLSI
jgi:hypothetical protein